MKPNEIVKIDEGIGDWFAKKGFLGRTAQRSALGKQFAADFDQSLDQSRAMLRQQFIKNLKVAIDGAMNAGLIKTAAVPESAIYESYQSFNTLLERKILNEAMTVQQFVKKYMQDLLVNFGQLKAPHSTQINALAKELAGKYQSSQSSFPNDIAGKLYDLSQDVKRSKASGAQNVTQLGKAGYPKTDVKAYDYQGTDVSFDLASKKWSIDSNGQVITKKDQIDAINQYYYDEQKRLKRLQQGQQQGAGSPAGATPSATPTAGATPSATPTAGATPSATPTAGATPAKAKKSRKPTPGSNAFGQMAQQLGGPTQQPAQTNPGASAFGQMAQQLGSQSATTQQPQTSPGAQAFGQMAQQLTPQTAPKAKKRTTKKAAPGANAFGQMSQQLANP